MRLLLAFPLLPIFSLLSMFVLSFMRAQWVKSSEQIPRNTAPYPAPITNDPEDTCKSQVQMKQSFPEKMENNGHHSKVPSFSQDIFVHKEVHSILGWDLFCTLVIILFTNPNSPGSPAAQNKPCWVSLQYCNSTVQIYPDITIEQIGISLFYINTIC